MFLQRNVAGQVFTIPGTLRLIADGSAVTSGAALTWVKDGSSAGSAGTLTHVTDGGYTYQPTQAETDAKICGWVLTKTASVGVSGSIRTTNADPNDGTDLGLTDLTALSALNVNGVNTLALHDPGLTLATGSAVSSVNTAVSNLTSLVAANLPDNVSITWIKNFLESDRSIVTSTTPWTEVTKIKSTATVLTTKLLRDVNGNNITSTAVVIGSAKES